ncbi:hypothetical protein [Flavobacterium sp. 5]|uniref:hypothetical protein n=1 Tax=Flavobacterium sp. 5 TaxID=2035199 RepID=UPI000C2CABD8|nr:hypothetical protein [Flavobacterium sp. 5]PKB16094.1 hypothetical protein CLU82_1212 [Flavobacterium sp. 5]
MKNFLIPTRLTPDTIAAVKTAINHSENGNTKIILFFVTDEIDSFSAAQYLREQDSQITHKELDVLDSCRDLIKHFPNCKLEFKRQSGISSPLFKNFLQFHSVDLILLTKSIVTSKKSVHTNLVQSIENQKTPILRLINDSTIQLNKAIYLENAFSRLNIDDVQQYMQDQFPLQKISQVLKKEQETSEYINFLLTEVLSKNDIDFVIETRTSERSKIKNKKQNGLNQHFDIPVLSLHEETV